MTANNQPMQPSAKAAPSTAAASNSAPATPATPFKATVDPTKAPQVAKPLTNAQFKIEPIGESARWVKALFYGKHGMGKTTLAATAVDCDDMCDVLMVDAEIGKEAIIDNPRIKHFDEISRIHLSSFKQCAYVHDWLFAHCKHRDSGNLDKLRAMESEFTGVPIEDITTPKQYRTVILDPLNEIEAMNLYALRGIKESQLYQDPTEMEKMEFKEWGQNNEMAKMLVRRFRNLPMHVIFCCAAAYVKDEMNRMHYTLQLTGKLSDQIQGMVDIVGFLVSESQPGADGHYPRHLFVQPGILNGGRYDAKNRKAKFRGIEWADPTMTQIMRDTGMIK